MTKSKRRPTERDLRSKSHVRWAEAVVYASNHGCHNPYCGADGYCHAGGTCFSPLSSGSMQKRDLVKAIHELYDWAMELVNQVDELKKELKKVKADGSATQE